MGAYDENRLKIIKMNKSIFIELIKGNVSIKGIQKDAKVHEVNYNLRNGCFELVISSMAFQPIIEGCELEEIAYFCVDNRRNNDGD